MKLFSRIITIFILSLAFSFTSFGNCTWYSTYCNGGMSEYEAYCVNAGGNTNISCVCGRVESCGPHTPPEE